MTNEQEQALEKIKATMKEGTKPNRAAEVDAVFVLIDGLVELMNAATDALKRYARG